jgi:bifunctional non-homologous end joining protein LigD
MRFVVHHHVGHPSEPEHYDLMIEQEEALATWRLSSEYMAALLRREDAHATKISDHRKRYLSYQGPISCDRGMVKIVDSGNYECVLESENTIVLWMHGEKLSGTIIIAKQKGNAYIMTLQNDA